MFPNLVMVKKWPQSGGLTYELLFVDKQVDDISGKKLRSR